MTYKQARRARVYRIFTGLVIIGILLWNPIALVHIAAVVIALHIMGL